MSRRKQPTSSPSAEARAFYKVTTKDINYVKKLRKLGASDYEIANALGIPENAPILHKQGL